jgi:H+/gluconate symporter-like permease
MAILSLSFFLSFFLSSSLLFTFAQVKDAELSTLRASQLAASTTTSHFSTPTTVVINYMQAIK